MAESSLNGENVFIPPTAYKRTPAFLARFYIGMMTGNGPASLGIIGASSNQIKDATLVPAKKKVSDSLRKLVDPEYAPEA
jgi:hypothetical protein